MTDRWKYANFAVVEVGNPVVTQAWFYRDEKHCREESHPLFMDNLNKRMDDFEEQFEFIGGSEDFGKVCHYQAFAYRRKPEGKPCP